MNNGVSITLPTIAEAASFTPEQFIEQFQHIENHYTQRIENYAQQVEALQHQVEWFKRQIFGQKSERRLPADIVAAQGTLGQSFDDVPATTSPEKKRWVAAHERTQKLKTPASEEDESALFFDPEKVPVQTIEVANPEMTGLTKDQYEIIGEKVTHRLAQQPGSYVVLKYVRPVIKRLDTQVISCSPAPAGVIDGSRADVSFIAGLLVDKFAYHLPLYRQHQRLIDAGFKLSRPWLTQLVQRGIGLLELVYDAHVASILASRVKAMDETGIKAGQAGPGKMQQGYFWPVYGELDEICFPFFPSRSAEHVQKVLGLTQSPGSVLLSDGYIAYEKYAKKSGVTHAQCWSHCRRGIYEAQGVEPEAAAEGLDMIGKLYAVEAQIREQKLSGNKKRDYRLEHAKPVVEQFFAWIEEQFARQGLLPTNPLIKALAYARERRAGLEVYLTDPDVPIDTNHLERTLRTIPMGRRNWLFCWTELGAKQVGIIQSLVATCRLHNIDPYTYLVDVLQRVGTHPAARVAELTPRLWKQHFADNPLRSDLYARRE